VKSEEFATAVKENLKKIYRIVFLTIRFFTAKRVMTQASALTYSTLLAIVPILAVVFAIARGFGYNKYIELWFLDTLSSQPQAAEAIVGFVNGYLIHTQSGLFLGIGLIFMLYTVLMLMNNVEETFNQIWQVSNSRPIIRSFTNYLAMFLLFPIIVIITTGLSVFMATIANSLKGFELLGPAVHTLLDYSPYLLLSLLFIGLYVHMPNTKVKVSCAIVPGIMAGVAMQLLQMFYIHSQIWVTGYNAIYGSFAALPLFMLWVQISWTICLFGAQLTYTNQNMNRFGFNLEPIDIHPHVDMTDDERGPEATQIYADQIDGL
jgi:membrane protein